ncbi:hypothetical protein [Cellulomonas triticagri]|uniref:RAMA domain-containing protein n=1 Tax=Cellulomonas triticagri TaxID=2483352 RepID=A0A3M2IYP0_9CELL|nr:hypothetical protein [Cellulomonas triticagri]RMI04926.1 hypothetical protein EBM89_17215 [Cellulomonas triticagri]
MAIFELDGGRGSLVQPMRPRTDSFEVDSATLVGEHAAALVGEQVLPVREGASGGPHLLALDAAARPLVVEVAPLLDEAALVRALRHAGGAARLSRSDLARMYPGGGEAFEADLAVFRDRAPLVRAQATGGVRLVIVCSDVAEGALDAVDFVTSGLEVQVLRLGVTQGPGGRRYVEVAPLPTGPSRTDERRAVEPGPRTGSIQVAPRASGAAVTDPTPVVATLTPPAVAPAAPPTPGGRRGDETTLIPPVPAQDPTPDAAPSHVAAPVAAPAPAPASGADAEPLPRLAVLAAAEGQDLELVWHRVRRGQRFVATLRQDGLIQLADGSVHADPGAAATVAADLETPTDGWRVWRFGDDGPTLGEAVAG